MFNLWKRGLFFEAHGAGGGEGGEGGQEGADSQATFEAWLKEQPVEIQEKYEAHVGSLKSALKKERETAQKNKADAKRLAELEAAEAKRKEEELTTAEKAQKALDEQKAETARLQAENKTLRLKSAFKAKAGALKLEFASDEAADDAFSKLDLELVGDDMKGMEAAVKAVAEKYAYYFERAEAEETDATRKGNKNSAVIANDELIKRKKQQGTYSTI